MTNDEINRAVAVALGWIPMDGGMGIGWFQIGTTVKAPPHWQFCSDPAAADLVRLEIEWRGWIWSIDPGIEGRKRYFCYVSGGTPRCPEAPYATSEADSWMEALCLAFLAAVEAEKEASK